MHNEKVKKKAIRLRTEKKMSLKAIAEKLGVAKSTISVWLRDYPLSKKELRRRREAGGRNSRGGGRAPRVFVKSPLHKLAAKKLTYSQRAKIAEAAVLLRLLVRGYEVYGSLFDGDKFDWVVYIPTTNRTYKLQVKITSFQKDTNYQYTPLRRNKGRSKVTYKAHEGDFFVGYDLLTDIAHVYSFDEVQNFTSGIKTTEETAERWDKLEANAE